MTFPLAQGWAAWAGWWALLVVGTAMSAFFSGMETGIYRMNKIRLDLRADSGVPAARRLSRMLGNTNNVLAVLLIGTNVANYSVTFAVTTMFVLAGTGRAAEWYALAAASPLLFVFGETVPKSVFHRRAETLTYRLSGLLRLSDLACRVTGFSPLVLALSWLLTRPLRGRREAVEERLGAVFAEGQASGVLTQDQSVMVDRVMNIHDVRVEDAMTPMRRVTGVRSDISQRELLETIRRSSYSRLPVRDARGAVTGVLDVYDVLTEDDVANPTERMSEPLRLPVDLTVTEALYRMQRLHKRLAVVRSAGRDVGIVTIKDLVEEIVGELKAW